MDAALFEAAKAKAGQLGLGPLVRALLKAYLRGEVALTSDDMLAELTTAPKGPRPRKQAKK